MSVKGNQLLSALNVRFIGSGSRVVVMAHGFGGNQGVWESLVPSFVKTNKVVLFDWPGAGTTNPDDFDSSMFESYAGLADSLLGVLEVLQIGRCSYIGHSMSAMIGCIAAIKKPELFDKLIFMGGSPRYLNDMDYLGGFEQGDIEQTFQAIQTDYKGWAAAFARVMVGVDDKHAIDQYEKSLLEMRVDIACTLAKTIFKSDYRDILSQVKVSVHILQTNKDAAVPMVVADYMRRNLGSKATVEVLQTEGHLPHATAPDLLITTLQEILMTD